jgi:hypothetical protein
MSTDKDSHPSLEQLAAFDTGCLPAAAGAAVERHVAGCGPCCRALETLPEDALVALVRAYAAGPQRPPAAEAGESPAGDGTAWDIPAPMVGHPRYRVLGVLGSGGMGVVYKAVQRHTDRVVALKVIRPKVHGRPDFVERFRREARAVARLQHPNIVLAYDADEAGGLHFLVMEYVEGTGLDRVLRQRGPLPVREACEYARQAALGLQHAHERGMVHRDVKPANLLLTLPGPAPAGDGPFGTVKIVDFGLAHLAALDGGPATAVSSAPVLGTLDYVAPEQARDPAGVDIRADVYSLGCTLYHLLTGQPPFPGGTPLQKLLWHQERPPRPVTELRQDVPARVAAVLERMLAKEPGRRHATPAEVAEDLAALSGPAEGVPDDRRVGTGRPRSRRARRLLLGAAVLLAAAVVVAVVAWPRGNRPDKAEPVVVKGATQPAPGPAGLAGPEDEVRLKREARDLALALLRATNRWGPGGKIVSGARKEIDAVMGKTEGFEIVLGPRLVKSGKLTLVVGRLGEVFHFEPTPEESRALRLADTSLKDNSLRFIGYLTAANDLRRSKLRVTISDLRIAPADTPRGKGRLVGALSYRLLEPVADRLHVRMTYYPAGRLCTMGMSYLGAPLAARRGEVRFDLPGLNDKVREDGLVVVFVEMASRLGKRDVIESNTLAALLRAPAGPPGP